MHGQPRGLSMHLSSLRLAAQEARAPKTDVEELTGLEQTGASGRRCCETTVSSWRMSGRHAIWVATLGGHTCILNSRRFTSGGSFAKIRDGCLAAVSPDH